MDVNTVVGTILTIRHIQEPADLGVVGEYLLAATGGEYTAVVTTITWSETAAASAGVPALGELVITCDSNIDSSYATGTPPNVQFFTVTQSRVIAEAFTGAVFAPIGDGFTLTYSGTVPDTIALSAGDYVTALAANRLAKV